MSDVYQCPHCELRFGAKWELEFHLSNDHPAKNPDPEPVYDDDNGPDH